MEKYCPEVFIAPSAEAEALGQVLLVFIEMAQDTSLMPVLVENDLTAIEPHRWYPMQNALNVFKALYQDHNSPNYDVVRIGMKAMETCSFPAEVNSIEAALRLVDGVAKAFSRNVPDDFGFPLEVLDEGHILITNNTPVPASGVYGFLWSIINNRKSPEEIFLLRILPGEPGKPAVFEITWETIVMT